MCMNTCEMKQYVTVNAGKRYMFLYRGISCRQSHHVFDALDSLVLALENKSATTIIEIGTYHGAFTNLLNDHTISNDAVIHTFDILRLATRKNPNAHYHVGDCFNDQLPVIRDLIMNAGRCLIFCDGGSKEREVNTFSQFLKSGDIIMCHDYAKNLAIANDPIATGGWPAPGIGEQPESQYANIQVELEKNNCVPFIETEMQKAVWGCFIKQ